jgi:uncharacterized protein (DUF736 family)
MADKQYDNKPLKSVGSLWRGKQGSKAVLNGSLKVDGKDARILVFVNEERKTDKHPEFRIAIEVDSKEQELSFGSASGGGSPVPF